MGFLKERLIVGYKNEKGVIITKIKNKDDNSKHKFRNFSGAVVDSVGSVQCQIVL